MAAPSLHTLLKNRLAVVRDDLDEVFARLTDDMLTWAPAPGMRTVQGQLSEIVGTEVQLKARIVHGQDLSYQKFQDKSGSLAGLRSALDDERQDTIALIDSYSEGQLNSLVAIPEGWFEALLLPEVPLAEVFRSLAKHEWYHVGQLVSYMWSRGDDPYSW